MSTRRSLALSFLDRYAALLIAILSSMAIARLLTPEEVGVYSITAVWLALLSTVRDFGAGQYLVQAHKPDRDDIRSAWAVQLGVGLALSLLTLVLSLPLASFYDDRRLAPLMLVLALNYAINPFGAITYAWLMREMRFGALATMRLSAALTTALVSIGLASLGQGPISLAWGNLAGTLVGAMVATYYRPTSYPWMPGLSRLREVFSFGSRLTLVSILNTITNGAPDFSLGKLQGLAATGLYSRANGLVSMFRLLIDNAVLSVAMPHLAAIKREGGNPAPAFIKILSYMTVLGWTFSIVVGTLAHSAIRVLYGDQWDASAPIVGILAIATIFQVPVGACQTALTSLGQAQRILNVTLITSGITVSLVATGAWHGLESVAWGFAAASAVNMVLWLRAIVKALGLDLAEVFAVLRHSALIALGAAIPALVMRALMGTRPEAPFVQLLVATPLVAAMLAGLCYFTRHPIGMEIRRLLPRPANRS